MIRLFNDPRHNLASLLLLVALGASTELLFSNGLRSIPVLVSELQPIPCKSS